MPRAKRNPQTSKAPSIKESQKTASLEKKKISDHFFYEYGTDVKRLKRIFNKLHMPFKSAYLYLDVNQEISPDIHNEKEIFICLQGRGETKIDNESYDIEPEDAWYIKHNQTHKIKNTGKASMTLLSVWWE